MDYRRTLAIVLLVPFTALTIYALTQVGYIGILDYHRHSPAGWQVFIDLVIACVLILTWLVHFGIVNTRYQFVHMVGEFLYKITEPALRPIRRFIPAFGGIDISPVILILLLWFAKDVIARLALKLG